MTDGIEMFNDDYLIYILSDILSRRNIATRNLKTDWQAVIDKRNKEIASIVAEIKRRGLEIPETLKE